MDKKKILTYKDICKIKLTSEGFILYDEALNENIKVEEFEFKDNLGKKQISDRLFYMMGEGYVITAKNTEMRSYIKLDNFLDHLNIQYKDSSRLKFEEELKKEEEKKQKKIEHRNKLENYKRPKEN